jgi:hypothetical protein
MVPPVYQAAALSQRKPVRRSARLPGGAQHIKCSTAASATVEADAIATLYRKLIRAAMRFDRCGSDD